MIALSPAMAERLAAQARDMDVQTKSLRLHKPPQKPRGGTIDRAAATFADLERRAPPLIVGGPAIPGFSAATIAVFDAALRTFPEPHPALDPKNAIRGDRK